MLEPHGTLADGKGITLLLWRKPNKGKPPVLLLHGASACHESFIVPEPEGGEARCLVDFLHEQGLDPWVLDWRGSHLVVENASAGGGDFEKIQDQFTFDRAAAFDIPEALCRIRQETDAKQISAVGHCMGSATLAQAIAGGHVGPNVGLSHVVLLALGLFYVPAWDSRVKSHDYVLERLQATGALVVDPRPSSAWAGELLELYENWPNALRAHPEPASDPTNEMCNRIGFMYGPPYLERNLAPGIHCHGSLDRQFGAIALRMYLHAAQNVRRGWAAAFGTSNDDTTLVGNEALERFRTLDSITLMTGARNQLWHRDSIDRMHEWLMRGPHRSPPLVRRHILEHYAHQDLLWGANARSEVFDKIREGLPR
jgi:pimeloyl-ACP methyl ester carboxylesterase